ncbi:MAG: GNAT family N-acetyltransferase [Planctomycetes bacterium]|nr:GNAT family N-acetyltransferase [Planctomycetota bacterium]
MQVAEGLLFAVEDANSPEAQSLIARLDADLHSRYPALAIHGFHPDEIAESKGAFVIARIGGAAIGCGAVRPLEPGVGEIKRMYVEPQMRGKGVARAILRKLEEAGRNLGFNVIRLETGTLQPEAIRLYETSGYSQIPRFGEYADDPYSVCFEKRLV